jgi:hypothetical protein
MKIGSSPNYLKGEELVYLKCPVISGARKKSHLACNHEAHISPNLWRGFPLFLRSFLVAPPLRFADGQQGVYGERISRRCLRRNLPSFRALGEFSSKIWPTNLEMILKI